MATSAGAMNSGVGVVRKTKVTGNRNAKAKQNSKILACVLLVGVLCLSVVVMSAFAANLNRNCITVGDSKSSGKTNLASAIKDEAYE